jgi:hypothetical protein
MKQTSDPATGVQLFLQFSLANKSAMAVNYVCLIGGLNAEIP